MGLTAKQKRAWQLHHRQGIAQKDIARQLGLRPESVCRLLARARRQIDRTLAGCRDLNQRSEMLDLLTA